MLSDAELQLQIDRIRGDTTLPRPPRPVAPVFTKSDSYPKRIKLIQRYIYEFEVRGRAIQHACTFAHRVSRPSLLELVVCEPVFRHKQYNHTDQNYFNVNKERPYGVIMASARDVTRECLPIKCMEAVMLALLLTNSIPAHAILRLPLRFKTKLEGHTFRYAIQLRLATRCPPRSFVASSRHSC
jgi:hypothetical protein